MPAPYLPSLTVFDPAESAEGTVDPLGLAQLATRIAERLAPDFRERVRRPRFFTALVLGAAVLGPDRYEGGPYAETHDGPRYLAWERLVVESFARGNLREDAERFIGVPGIDKARQARDYGARLGLRLYLKNPTAAGWWVAYKGIGAEIGLVDGEGNVLPAGRQLLRAWAKAVGEAELANADSRPARFVQFDGALEALLGEESSELNPRRAWNFLAEALDPDGLSRHEAEVLRIALREGGRQSGPRASVMDHLEIRLRKKESLRDASEAELLRDIERRGGELGDRASLAVRYEALATEVTAAFDCILHAGGKASDGRVNPGVLEADERYRAIFAEAPKRIGHALDAVDSDLLRIEPQLAEEACTWMRQAIAGDVRDFFEALVERHVQVQRRKPPSGKRAWIEGASGERRVRRRYVPDYDPSRERTVHTYRTRAVRSCVVDIMEAQ